MTYIFWLGYFVYFSVVQIYASYVFWSLYKETKLRTRRSTAMSNSWPVITTALDKDEEEESVVVNIIEL